MDLRVNEFRGMVVIGGIVMDTTAWLKAEFVDQLQEGDQIFKVTLQGKTLQVDLASVDLVYFIDNI